MNEPVTISTIKPAEPALDYERLKIEGLKHIQNMAGLLWTDYNVHDPGVTSLEVLSYAITDLAYRTAQPVENLLASSGENAADFKKQFYTAQEILPCRPVNERDYRKLVIDIDGVKNVWLFKAAESLFIDCKDEVIKGEIPGHKNFNEFYLNGICNIRLELDQLTPAEELMSEEDKKARVQAIIDTVKNTFQCNRNLCEDIKEVTVIEEQKILVCADIEIKPEVRTEKVYADILYVINNYLGPAVRQYTLAEMLVLKKSDGTGYTTDEIFNGPLLKHGFITDEDLDKSGLRKVLYASDLISLIMDIEGVVAVKELLLNYCDAILEERREWCLPVSSGKKPGLCIEKLAIHFFKDVVPVNSNKTAAVSLFQKRLTDERLQNLAKTSADLPVEPGAFMDTETYTSITNHFPSVYGIGSNGLPLEVPARRKAAARQLKAYLLFFDQVLANYLSQLTQCKKIFRVDQTELLSQPPQSYYFQQLQDIKEVDALIKDYSNYHKPGKALDTITKIHDDAVDRRNRFLEHLIARFAENFNEYVMQQYNLTGDAAFEDVMVNKALFLKDYPAISANRGGGYVYGSLSCNNQPVSVWDSLNVSGLEHRVSRMLGIRNYQRRTLSLMRSEVYQEKDTDNVSEFRFRLMAKKGRQVLLSGSTKYTDKSKCENDFLKVIALASNRNNYTPALNKDGKHYFNITDEKGDILARRMQYFATEDEMKTAINAVLNAVTENYSDEGMHVVEHILLRPDDTMLAKEGFATDAKNYLPVCTDKDCTDGCEEDPYSFRITVVLPAEALRFSNMHFREYIEKIIRMETPAHIFPKVCWVNKEQLSEFETEYKKWLIAKQKGKLGNKDGLEVHQKLITALYNLKSIYPTGKLTTCENTADNPIILGRTNLGNK
jgi:uncharacterized protein